MLYTIGILFNFLGTFEVHVNDSAGKMIDEDERGSHYRDVMGSCMWCDDQLTRCINDALLLKC